MISLKPVNSNLPSKILRNNKELTDCKSIANAFTDFFANIGHSLALMISSVNTSSMTFMPPNQENSIYIDPISSKEIEEEIDKLDSSKATVPYSISTKILKLIKYAISKPLETIFNLSLTNGVIPDYFKLARVIPVFKKGSHFSLNNYCPISLLSVFNRIHKKIIFKRLMNFIVKNKILYNKQFGFRQKQSTLMVIVSVTDKIKKAIDDGNYACGIIFLDFTKAF